MTYWGLLRLTVVSHLLAAGTLFPGTIYVDPASGDDTFPGTQAQPLRTVTRALAVSSAGTSIHMAPGIYQSSTGEIFPLQVPAGVSLPRLDHPPRWSYPRHHPVAKCHRTLRPDRYPRHPV